MLEFSKYNDGIMEYAANLSYERYDSANSSQIIEASN